MLQLIASADAENAAEVVSEELDQVKEQANVFVKYVQDSVPGLISFGLKLAGTILILFIGLKIIKVLRSIVRKSFERAGVDRGVIQFLDSLLKYMLYVVLVMIIVGRYGVASSSIVAVVGSAGLAIGMALQGSLSNLAGGVIILVVKPFMVGDYIIATEEGTVTEIGLVYTTLLTADNKKVLIPNGNLANGNIVNVTAMDKRRIDFSIGISYTSDLKLAKDIMYELLQSNEKRLSQEDAVVYVEELGDSAVVIGGRLWVAAGDYWDVRWELTEKLKLAYDENGVEMPYNQLDVHVDGSLLQTK